jgi:hypothetical protein
MFNEIFRRLLVGVPGLLLIRSGILVGILLGNFMQYIQQEPRSVEQKNALVGLAKREGLWYAGAVSSLLLAYFFHTGCGSSFKPYFYLRSLGISAE